MILITDGLPTMGESGTNRRMVTSKERLNLHWQAIREIPSAIPVNVLLFPMEGDYDSAVAYWALAYRTGGAMISLSEDWP